MRSRRSLRLLLGLAVVLGLVFVLGACGGNDEDDSAAQTETAKPTSLRVGYGFELDAGGVGDRVAFQTLEQKTGIKAAYSVLGNPRNTIVALQRGDIDIAKPGFYSTVEAINQGAEMQIVLATGMVSELVLAGVGVGSVADLAGKRIGYHLPKDETEIFARFVVTRAGLEGEVKLISLPESTNRATALAGGRLDAAVLEFVDYLRLAQEEPDMRLLANAKGLFPFPVTRVNVVKKDFGRKSPGLLQRITNGLLDGYESLYTDEGRERWIAEAKKSALEGESDEFVEQIYAFYRDVGMWPRRSDVPTQEAWNSGVRFRLDEGLLEPPVPSFQQVFDVSFWRKAAGK